MFEILHVCGVWRRNIIYKMQERGEDNLSEAVEEGGGQRSENFNNTKRKVNSSLKFQLISEWPIV